MGPLDLERGEKGCGIVGKEPRRIWTGRFVALPGAAWVEGDAGEMLGVVCHLERISGVVGRQIGDQQQWLARALLLVIYGYVIDLDLRHGPSSLGFAAESYRWVIPQKDFS
jgi:hypothetical protein